MRPSFSQQLRHGGLLDVHTYTALNNSERQLDSIFKEVKSPRRVELRENEINIIYYFQAVSPHILLNKRLNKEIQHHQRSDFVFTFPCLNFVNHCNLNINTYNRLINSPCC